MKVKRDVLAAGIAGGAASIAVSWEKFQFGPPINAWYWLFGLGIPALIVWLFILPAIRDGDADAGTHKPTSETVAFRSGKALNRIWRRLKGRA